jgi:hypothetical protein
MKVWRGNYDPPTGPRPWARWAGKWECVEEWWTAIKRMAYAVRSYREALTTAP